MNKISSDDMATFIRVIERGSFAAAADDTGLTPSGISRAVSRLEDRLGVRLIQRTTRQLQLTPEGETMLARGRDILAAIEAAESEVTASRGKPQGLLRVNTGTAYAKHRLTRLLPLFRARYPDIAIDLSINDRRVDIIAEQLDLAIRTGPLENSSLVARKLGEFRREIVASPAYLARAGTPELPGDLNRHDCIIVGGTARLAEWPLRINNVRTLVTIKPAFTCDSADIALDLALAGAGIVRLSTFMTDHAVADGRLVALLTGHHLSEKLEINAVMPPGRQHLPRVRVFLDALRDEAHLDDPPAPTSGARARLL